MNLNTNSLYQSPLSYVREDALVEFPSLALDNANLPILGKHPKLLIPTYDRSKLTASIVHFGLGNFHRSHQCAYYNALLHIPGNERWGEIAIGMRHESDPNPEFCTAQNGLFSVTEKPENAKPITRVFGNLLNYIAGDLHPDQALKILTDDAIQLITLTVTEGGYYIDPTTGKIDLHNAQIVYDIATDLAAPSTVFGMIVAAIRERRKQGKSTFTVLSCDNMPYNGDVTHSVVTDLAHQIDPDLALWITENISFPNSMVDRITPAATYLDKQMLELVFDMDDTWPVVCEPFIQWVIEDNFSSKRPPLEKVGAMIVPHVTPYENAKLRILNASHIAIGCFGGLLGTRYCYETMQFPQVHEFIKGYMFTEAIPTLEPLPDINLEVYADIVLSRFHNSKIADTTLRLLNSISDRLINFLLPVIKDLLAHQGDISYCAFICAAWAQCFVPQAAGLDINSFYEYRSEELIAAANHPDLSAFLSVREVFGNLDSHPEFVNAFVHARISIIADGIEQAIENFVHAQNTHTHNKHMMVDDSLSSDILFEAPPSGHAVSDPIDLTTEYTPPNTDSVTR